MSSRQPEERQAIDLVAAQVVPPARECDEVPEPPTVRIGLPGFNEVAVVARLGDTPRVVVSSGPIAAQLVAREARSGHGPSTDAVMSGELVVCRDLERERRWPDLDRRDLGLRRWVAVPLGVPGADAIGAVVLGSAPPGIVNPFELAAIGVLADQWSLTLTACLAAGGEPRAVLSTDSEHVVGLALGVLMASDGLTESTALKRLMARSRAAGSALVDEAVSVLDERRMSWVNVSPDATADIGRKGPAKDVHASRP